MTPSGVRALTLHEYSAFRDYMNAWITAQQNPSKR